MTNIDVLAHGFEFGFAADAGIKWLIVDRSSKLSMSYKISVPADGRREMRVYFRG
jgi:hypothetical protein